MEYQHLEYNSEVDKSIYTCVRDDVKWPPNSWWDISSE